MLGAAIIWATSALFNIITLLIIVQVIASWLPFLYNNEIAAKILDMVNALVEPLMKPVRRLMQKTPLGNMPLDFSPIIVLLLLELLQTVIVAIVRLLL